MIVKWMQVYKNQQSILLDTAFNSSSYLIVVESFELN